MDHKYKRIPSIVHAWLVTEGERMPEFVLNGLRMGYIDKDPRGLLIVEGCPVRAGLHYIVRDASGSFFVHLREDFESNYEKCL